METTTIISAVEIAGTMAFAISGIRLAATKRFDLFGAYVVGLVTAIGGGTIRDVLLGCTPIWMEQAIYLIITAISLLFVILMGKRILLFKNTFFIFDTIGLALFTVVGLDKALDVGFPLWVAIIMGVVTGSFGGVLRDMMVGDVPLLFRRDIYALASMLGGLLLGGLLACGVNEPVSFVCSALCVVNIRLLAMKFHLHLPTLVDPQDSDSRISITSQRDKKS
ncbi:MAG: trimeric intracellular cation channel family protein [Rikenellaceae bacterium]